MDNRGGTKSRTDVGLDREALQRESFRGFDNSNSTGDSQSNYVRKKYNFAKLTKEDLYEIITNITVSYNSDETSLRNRLQELGVKSGNLLSIDFAAAIREGNRNDGLGTIQGRGRGNQTVKDTSDVASREDKGEEHFFITPQGEIYGFVAPNEDVITTANDEYTINYKGVEDFDIIEYHKINKTIHDEYDRKRGQIPNAINQLSGGNEITEGEYNSNNYNASEGEANGYNAGLDKEAPQGESQQTQSNASSKEYQGRNTRLSRYHKDNVSWIRK